MPTPTPLPSPTPTPTPTPSPSPGPTLIGPGDPGLTEEERRSYFLRGYEEGVSAGVKRVSEERRPRQENNRLEGVLQQPYPMLFIGAICGLVIGILLAKAIF